MSRAATLTKVHNVKGQAKRHDCQTIQAQGQCGKLGVARFVAEEAEIELGGRANGKLRVHVVVRNNRAMTYETREDKADSGGSGRADKAENWETLAAS